MRYRGRRPACLLVVVIMLSVHLVVVPVRAEVTSAQMPDLMLLPDDISFSDDTPVVGQTVTVWADVHNVGNDIAYNVPVYFYDNFTNIGVSVLPLVEPGRDRSTYTLWTPSRSGLTNITVVIDPFDLIKESREDNNAAWRDINVLEPILPDLLVEDISFSNDEPADGETITVTATIRNSGPAEATGVVAAFMDNNTVFTYGYVTSIAPNMTYPMSVQWVARANAGDVRTPRVIQVFADPEDRISEISESNNTFTRLIYVGRPLLPDLTTSPEDIYLSVPVPVDNQTVTLYARITNLGPLEARNVPVVYLLDGTHIGTHILDTVPGGLSSLSWVVVMLPAGFHTVSVVIDPNGTVRESDRTNNAVNRSIVVDDYLPSISLRNLTFSASPVLENVTVTLYVEVSNTGRDAAYGLVVTFTDIYGTDGRSIGTYHLNKVSPGGMRMALARWFASPAGNHTIRVGISSEYTAGEFNLTHARISRNVTVLPSLPDLEAGPLSVHPSELTEGQRAAVNVTIRNIGVVEARGVPVILQDNGIEVDRQVITLAPDPTGLSGIRLTFNYTASAGIRNLTLLIDPENIIPEYDEGNNVRWVVLEVARGPVPVNWMQILLLLVIVALLGLTGYLWRERIWSFLIRVLAGALAVLLAVPLFRRMIDEISAAVRR